MLLIAPALWTCVRHIQVKRSSSRAMNPRTLCVVMSLRSGIVRMRVRSCQWMSYYEYTPPPSTRRRRHRRTLVTGEEGDLPTSKPCTPRGDAGCVVFPTNSTAYSSSSSWTMSSSSSSIFRLPLTATASVATPTFSDSENSALESESDYLGPQFCAQQRWRRRGSGVAAINNRDIAAVSTGEEKSDESETYRTTAAMPRLLNRWFSSRFSFSDEAARSTRSSGGSSEELAGGTEDVRPVRSHRRTRIPVRENGGNGDVAPRCAAGDGSNGYRMETPEGVMATTGVSKASDRLKPTTVVHGDLTNNNNKNQHSSSTGEGRDSGVSKNSTDVSQRGATLSTTYPSTHSPYGAQGQEECKHGAEGGAECGAGKCDGPAPAPGDEDTKSPVLPRARALWRAFSEVDHGKIEENHSRAAQGHRARFYMGPAFANPPACYVPY